MTFAQAVEAYLDAGKSKWFLPKILDYWQDTLLRQITGEAVRQSARKLYQGAGNATLNRQVIKPTRAVINFAADLWGLSKFAITPFPERVNIERIPASRERIQAFASQAETDGLPHLAALAFFMFGTGARIGEAVSLTWRDLSLEVRRATISMNKTGDTRTAHLPGPLVAAIANIPTSRNSDDQVFGYSAPASVTKVWRKVCNRAGLEMLTPNSCRHGFATEMLRNGFDVKTVWRNLVDGGTRRSC